MEMEIEIEEAERCWDYLHQLAGSGVRVILLHHGVSIGALISQDDYQWLQREKARRGITGPPPN